MSLARNRWHVVRLPDQDSFGIGCTVPWTCLGIAEIYPDVQEDEREELAKLIAAAPELLEALEGLIISGGGGNKKCGHEFSCICALDEAKAAIAKAKS